MVAEAALAAQQRAALASLAASCWLGLRLQLIAAAMAAGVAVAAVAQHAGSLPGGSGMTAGLVGLSLSYVIPITGLLSGLLTSSAETEQELVAAERVLQYLGLPSEGEQPVAREQERPSPGAVCHADWAAAEAGQASLRTPLLGGPSGAALGAAGDARPTGRGSGSWLREGRVEFVDVWLRYRPGGPFALRGLTLSIGPGSKVGICGRTGAGKSSLIACLLRLVDISSGSMAIDGLDVRHLRLRRLRSAVGIVPQQPFIFQGSVRDNLDPYCRHSDTELEQALRQVQLWTPLAALAGAPGCRDEVPTPANTDALLSLQLGGGGSDLSQGQGQLLALARVLLQRPPLLLLDECTASVDPATAWLIHALVRQQFVAATVVEVAHRLASILDCDTGGCTGWTRWQSESWVWWLGRWLVYICSGFSDTMAALLTEACQSSPPGSLLCPCMQWWLWKKVVFWRRAPRSSWRSSLALHLQHCLPSGSRTRQPAAAASRPYDRAAEFGGVICNTQNQGNDVDGTVGWVPVTSWWGASTSGGTCANRQAAPPRDKGDLPSLFGRLPPSPRFGDHFAAIKRG